MFRILIVEDDVEVLTALTNRIQREVIGSVIDRAESVCEANQAIDRTLSAREIYDCAILDFQLPTRDGDLRVDQSICGRLRNEMKETGIIHITTAANRPIIVEHIRKYHGGPNLRAVSLVDKLTLDFQTTTSAEARTYLYSRFIETKFRELFYSGHGDGETDASSALQTFERWLILMWTNLPQDTKNLVLTRFVVDDRDRVLVELR